MAIFSLSHSAVGRTTHAAGTAGAHAAYVTREGAAGLVLGEHMPTGRYASQAWLDAQEAADRKNARVIDKALLALPVELDTAGRAQLVRDFAAEVGGGRISWLAGIHDRGEDEHNPHAHVIFRDRDYETGKRVAELSGKGSTERLRETWERVANAALERAGHDARIDRRTLEAQGIDRQPGIHVGPNALAMDEKGLRPASIPLDHVTLRGNERVVNWPEIDQGRTRIERLAEIQAENQQREANRDRSKQGEQDPALKPVAEAQKVPADMLAIALAGIDPDLVRLADREKMAVILRDLDDRARDFSGLIRPAPALLPAPQPQDHAPAGQQSPAPTRAEPKPEAPQRPPQTPEQSRSPVQDVSRLKLAIGRARERLETLGDRLESAFTRVREIFERKAQAEQAASAKADLRRTLESYRRDWGRDSHDMEI